MALSLDQVSKKSKSQAKSRSKESAEKKQTKKAGRNAKAAKPEAAGPLTAELPPQIEAAIANAAENLNAEPIDTPESMAARPAPTRPQVRPWSQRGLAKQGRSPKEGLGRDHHVSEEWMNLHEAPLFWIDLSAESPLAALQEKLEELERKATTLLRTPKAIVSKVRKGIRGFMP